MRMTRRGLAGAAALLPAAMIGTAQAQPAQTVRARSTG